MPFWASFLICCASAEVRVFQNERMVCEWWGARVGKLRVVLGSMQHWLTRCIYILPTSVSLGWRIWCDGLVVCNQMRKRYRKSIFIRNSAQLLLFAIFHLGDHAVFDSCCSALEWFLLPFLAPLTICSDHTKHASFDDSCTCCTNNTKHIAHPQDQNQCSYSRTNDASASCTVLSKRRILGTQRNSSIKGICFVISLTYASLAEAKWLSQATSGAF